MFVKHSVEKKIVILSILIVYVYDIIITGDFEEELQCLRKYLAQEFEIKELGNLRYFLGMEVAWSKDGIVVTQRKYTLDRLKETGTVTRR